MGTHRLVTRVQTLGLKERILSFSLFLFLFPFFPTVSHPTWVKNCLFILEHGGPIGIQNHGEEKGMKELVTLRGKAVPQPQWDEQMPVRPPKDRVAQRSEHRHGMVRSWVRTSSVIPFTLEHGRWDLQDQSKRCGLLWGSTTSAQKQRGALEAQGQ
jgi:hypothetical protein